MKIGITKCARKDIPIKEKDTLIRRSMPGAACRGAWEPCAQERTARNLSWEAYAGDIIGKGAHAKVLNV